jgi:hypothetical protein
VARGLDFTVWMMLLVGETAVSGTISSQVLGKRRTPHTKEAHESYLMSKSLISRLAGREKMAQRLLSVGLILSSIWEKARTKDGL